MTARPVTIVDWRPWLFAATPVSGRDAVTARPWPIGWTYRGKRRDLVIPEDWRFGVATDKVPGAGMALLRFLVNCQHMQRSSCVHDLLYSTQGGRRPEETCTKQPIILPFDDVSREEADWVACAIAAADGINEVQAGLVHWGLDVLGRSAWND